MTKLYNALIMWRIVFMSIMYVIDICYDIVSHTIEFFIHLNKINKYISYVKRLIYDHILLQFNITVIIHHITANNRSDNYNMK